MTRLEANKEIIKRLTNYLKSNPDIRFGQALSNLGVVRLVTYPMIKQPVWSNAFNTEPEEMLQAMDQVEATRKQVEGEK